MLECPDLVSIIMPVYNAEAFVGEAIESVLAQTYRKWELIIINDGSTDHSAEMIAQFSDPRIVVLHKPNGGEASARNVGLDHAQGEIIAFLDADDLYEPNHLETVVKDLRDNPDFGLIYTNGWYVDAQGKKLMKLSQRRRGPFSGDIFAECLRSSDVFGPPISTAFRRAIVVDHPNIRFDTAIIIGPDWDFLIQVAEQTRCLPDPTPTVRYRVHGSNITIQTPSPKRDQSLIRCRLKALQMQRFSEAPEEVKLAVFYDLLVNLLRGNSTQQAEIIHHPTFQQLSPSSQSKLLRYMAGDAIIANGDSSVIDPWLAQAAQLDPSDWRAKGIRFFFHLHPATCRFLLSNWREKRNQGRDQSSPFSPFLKAQ